MPLLRMLGMCLLLAITPGACDRAEPHARQDDLTAAGERHARARVGDDDEIKLPAGLTRLRREAIPVVDEREALGQSVDAETASEPPHAADDPAPPAGDLIQQLIDAAEAGDPEAQFELAGLYYYGEGVPQDTAEMLKWIARSADAGYAMAQFALGEIHELGQFGLETNRQEAAVWFGRAAAQGHSDAQYRLGQIYYLGLQTPRNTRKAKELWTSAAEQGHAEAQHSLGSLYRFGSASASIEKSVDASDGGREVSERLLGAMSPDEDGDVRTDLAQAIQWYTRAAQRGHVPSYIALGELHLHGEGVPKNPAEGVDWLVRAAETGDRSAQCRLGRVYLDGEGVPRDPTAGIKWYRRAADAGDMFAQLELGRIFAQGEGIPKDPEEAARWFTRAAESNPWNPGLAYAVAQMYRAGDGVPADPAQALKWFRRAAEQGYVDAQASLGEMYENGEGTRRDVAEAVKWYTRAAEQGHASAQLSLGRIFFEGDGVAKDTVEAIGWLRRAAKDETWGRIAQLMLGAIYADGDGVPRDFAESLRWFEPAAEAGDVSAQWALGYIYETGGDGVTRSMTDAIKWYERAAAQGHASAQFTIGYSYYMGDGVPADKATALHWLREAANQGYARAQTMLGVIYYTGDGIERDQKEAVKWFQMAADQGNVPAQTGLGMIYSKGDGVPKDTAEAMRWLTGAAEQGHAPGQFFLARLHATGSGTPQNYVRAYSWANLAAAKGHEDARRLRDELARQMTPAQIAEAQRLSADFTPRRPQHADERPFFSAMVQADVTGSGFFVTTDGYFVTNHHVIEDARRVRVQTSTGTYSARLVRQDAANDLALLKVDGTFPVLHVRGSSGVRTADRVFTVGYPNPGLQGLAPKFSSGEIAALTGPGDDPRFFQISVPVQPGNSGGPLVDAHGSVVGVVIGQLDKAKALRITGHLPENVNYAVKGTLLMTLLESVPGVSLPGPPQPGEAARDRAAVATTVERATGIVLVDR